VNPLIAHVRTWVSSQLPDPGARGVLDQDRLDAALMAKVMNGPDGLALLEVLARATVLRPPTDPRLSGAASHDFCQRRTGENAVFGVVVHLLDLHDHLQRTETDDRRHDRPAPVFGWNDSPGLAGSYAPRAEDAGDETRAETGGGDAFDPAGNIAAG